jgi:hypothetical protein
MKFRCSALVVISAALVIVGCSNGEDALVPGMARTTMASAKAEADKGKWEDARQTCKIVDEDALRKLESDDGKKARAEFQALCRVDVSAGQSKAAIDDAFTEFQTALVKEPSNAEFKKGRVESACMSASNDAGYFETFKGTDRPLAKALAATIAAKCSAAALAIKAPPPPPAAEPAAKPAGKAVAPKAAG